MQIDLSNAFTHEEKVCDFTVSLEVSEISSPFGKCPIRKKTPVTLVVTHKKKRQVILEGNVEIEVGIPCDRCLKDVPSEFKIEFCKEIDFNHLEEDEDEKQEISNFITGYDLDVDQLICNEILVNWPMKVLCQENCKGICKKCGKNRNEGSCECDQTELDPRMAAIHDIFYEHYKEV